MPSLTVDDGTRIHYEQSGDGDVVLLLAGWGFSGAVWADQVASLEHRHRVVTVDLRGHGQSDAPDGSYAIERHAADVGAVIDHLHLHELALVGWSFGGLVALQVAATRAERVARLALVGSVGVATGKHDRLPFGRPAVAMLSALTTAERQPDRERSRRLTIAGGFQNPPPTNLLERLVADSLQTPSDAGIACLEALFETEQFDLLDAIADLPTWILAGDADGICSLDAVNWLRDQLRRPRVVTFERCGHYPMFERPTPFNAALEEFAGATIQTRGG